MDLSQLLVTSAEYKSAYDAASAIRASFVAAATLGLWDIITTFEQERRLVWPRRRSLGKWAFLIGRYWFIFGWLPLCASSVFGVYSVETCKRVFWIHPFSCIFAMLPCQCILTFRVLAVYNWRRSLVIILSSVVVIAVAAPIAILASLHSAPSLPGIPGCPPTSSITYDYAWAAWLPGTIVEVLVFGLILSRFFATRGYRASSGPDLMGRLAIDSFFYFLPVASITIANLALFIQAYNTAAKMLAMYPMVALSVTLSSRLILCLHQDMLGGGHDEAFNGSLQSRILNFITGGSGRSLASGSLAQCPSVLERSTPQHVVVLTEVSSSISEPAKMYELESPRPHFAAAQ